MSVRPRFTYPSNDTFDFDEYLLNSGLHNPVVQLGVLRSCSTISRQALRGPILRYGIRVSTHSALFHESFRSHQKINTALLMSLTTLSQQPRTTAEVVEASASGVAGYSRDRLPHRSRAHYGVPSGSVFPTLNSISLPSYRPGVQSASYMPKTHSESPACSAACILLSFAASC